VRFAVLSATAVGGFGPPGDDRSHADPARGLFLVADASGSTDGGYRLPLGVDRGLEVFRERFDATAGQEAVARMRAGLEAADVAMRELGERYAGRMGVPPAHFGASVTACAIGPEGIAVAQVGSARAYRSRAGVLELLAPDHTLATMLAADGQDVSDRRKVIVSLLGVSPKLRIGTRVHDVSVGDVVVLCTDGVWMDGADDVEALAAAQHEDELVAVVKRAADRSQDDATALCIRVEDVA